MPEAAILIEKRANPREKVKIRVQYCLIEDLTGIQTILAKRKEGLDAQALNLSPTGMFIVAQEKLEVGSLLHLDIFVPEHPQTLPASAEVVWVNEAGAGLRFIHLRNEYVELLKDFLAKAPASK